MNSKQIENSFWGHYILLEKEFMSTINYVKINVDNYGTFSNAYAKLLLQIGSEVDVLAKDTCRLLDPAFTGDKMKEYQTVLYREKDFTSTKVNLINEAIILDPWNDMETTTTHGSSIIWWKAYNKVKHERESTVTIDGVTRESYKFANLKNTLTAISGLYLLNMHSYYVALSREGETTKYPLPGSRLFKLSGPVWDDVPHFFDIGMYENNGVLSFDITKTPY